MGVTKGHDAAFPLATEYHEPVLGLTKREYFAAQIMGAMAWASITGETDCLYKDLAAESVDAADALIEALNERR